MPTATICYRVRKPMKVGLDKREPGDLVPEAADWPDHIVARLEHTQFMEAVPLVDEDELLAALSYVPHLMSRYGYEPVEVAPVPEPTPQIALDPLETPVPVVEARCTSCDTAASDIEGGLGDDGLCDGCQPLISQDNLIDDGPSLISQPADNLDALPWPELRKLGAAAGLGRDAKRHEITAHLRLRKA